MKTFLHFGMVAAVFMMSLLSVSAKNVGTITGMVKDSDGKPLEFCTVVLDPLNGMNQKGTITGIDGRFELKADAGEYNFILTMLGYERQDRKLNVTGNMDLGEIVMKSSAVEVESVVVKGEMIRRKADGYVVAIGQAPVAIGRSSLEIMSFIPGVWFEKDKGISINGKTGTMVMLNDRLLRYTGKELEDYLSTIKAEDIKSVEVIPNSGSKYDASATGGILKITLKKQADEGVKGSLGVSQKFADVPFTTNANVDLSYKRDKLSLYTGFNYGLYNNREHAEERTEYLNESGMILDNYIYIPGLFRNYFTKFGGVYEFTDRQSFGVDFDYSHGIEYMKTFTDSYITNKQGEGLSKSEYRNDGKSNRYSVAANYMIKFDSLGSSLSIMADYLMGQSPSNNYSNVVNTGLTLADMVYSYQTSNTATANRLYSARVDYNQYIGEKWQIETGAKYAYTNMHTDMKYRNKIDEEWVIDPNLTDDYLYREGVLAGYLNTQGNVGKFHIMAGLRVENTNLRPYSYTKPGQTNNQNYTNFFPSANISYDINKEKGYSLSLNYNRKVRRPGYNSLNPFRVTINEYTYIVGNPDLKPSYTDVATLSTILAGKYNISFSYEYEKGAVSQIVIEDPNNPGVLLYKNMNMDRNTYMYLSINFPVDVTKWWKMNLYANGGYSTNTINGYKRDIYKAFGRINNVFTLPKKWSIELSGYGNTPQYEGNMYIKSLYAVDAGIRKSFLNNKFTASLGINNIFDSRVMKADISTPGQFNKTLIDRNFWMGRTVSFSIRYNFGFGKDINVKRVKSGNDDEKSRL